MPTILNNGIQLPDKGSVDWYSSMESNYNLIDTHLGNTDIHVTAEDKANWDSKASGSHTHTSTDITDIDDYATKQYVDNSISGLVDNAPDALNTLNELSAALNDDSNFASTVTTALGNKANSADLATVATSGSYNDLSNKPTINDSTITIQKNGSTVDTFTTNGSAKTIDIPVPTKTSDLTNDSNFVDTSNSAIASGITSAKVTDYDGHIADTDIHVTTADKTKWNNQTYVVRYASVAVSDNSTVPYTDLNNTDNIKANDLLLDTNGKFYQITSVDTANETVSVTTPLTQLAVDSSVIHKTGNETKSGELTLNDTLNTSNIIPKSNNTYECGSSSNIWKDLYSYHGYFRGDQQGDEYSNNTRTNLTLLSNRDTLDESGILFDTYRQNTAQGTATHIMGFGIKENSVRYEGCRFSWIWDNNLNGYSFSIRPTLQGANQAVEHNLGLSTDKWDTINGLNPGALSLPDLSNGIDISGYLTAGNSNNTYTPPVNGWISISLGIASGGLAIFLEQGDMKASSYSNTAKYGESDMSCFACLPVVAGIVVNIGLKGSNNYIKSAKFFPCQGNV